MACARFGCTERAHTVLVFEPGSAAAWLMHAVEAHRTQGILLCRAHADVVTVPVGWNLVDERDPTWEPVRSAAAQMPDPSPEPEPNSAAKAKPEPALREAEVVDIASAVAEAKEEAPAAEAVPDEEAAFEEVVAAQWTDAQDSDDDVGTPTLFAVDDGTGTRSGVEDRAVEGRAVEGRAVDHDDSASDDNASDDNASEDDHGGASDSDPPTGDATAPQTPLLNRAFRAAERI